MSAIVKDVIVTKAREQEAPACLALLPEIRSAPVEFLIARKDSKFAGAVALLWANAHEPAGFGVAVRVLEAARRQGIGRELIEAAAGLADGETDGLWSLQATPLESPAAKFLEACGFVPRRTEHYFEVDPAALLDEIEPIARRYREHGRMPEGADVVFLADAELPLEEIAWLLAREFNSNPILNVHDLRRRREDAADRTVIARVEGEIVGVLMCRDQNGIAVVDARVVAKRWRSGWPNLLMLEKALSRAQAEGLRPARFFSGDAVTETRNLARRAGGKEIELKARHYLAFD